MDNCTLDCIMINGHNSLDQMCSYTQNFCVQDKVQFIQAYYCYFNSSFLALIFLGLPFLGLLFKTLHVIAQNYLSPCIEQFIEEFRISPTLAGVTFLAFANGSNDVITAIIAGSSDSQSTALIPFGSIFGACLFSTAFILSIVIKSQKSGSITLKLRQCALPVGFYLIGIVYIISVTTLYGQMNILLAALLFVIYIIYIIIVLRNQKNNSLAQHLIESDFSSKQDSIIISKTQNQGKQQTLISIDSQISKPQFQQYKQSKIQLLNQRTEKIVIIIFEKIIPFYKIQQWRPINAVTSLIISPFIVLLTQQISLFKAFLGPIPVMLIISLPSIILCAYTIFCIANKRKPYFIKPFTIYSFLITICAQAVVCSVLINFIQLVQILTGINSVLLGLTIFAWANCIGDYLIITMLAKQGNLQTAVAGIFSGQLFNFLAGFINKWAFTYKIFDFAGTDYDVISDSIIMTVIFGGLIYLSCTLLISIRFKGTFSRREALFSKWYYIGFLIVSCFLGIISDFFRQISCLQNS